MLIYVSLLTCLMLYVTYLQPNNILMSNTGLLTTFTFMFLGTVFPNTFCINTERLDMASGDGIAESTQLFVISYVNSNVLGCMSSFSAHPFIVC